MTAKVATSCLQEFPDVSLTPGITLKSHRHWRGLVSVKAARQTCGLRNKTPNGNPEEKQYYLIISPVRLPREIIIQISSSVRFQVLDEKRPSTPFSEVTSLCYWPQC